MANQTDTIIQVILSDIDSGIIGPGDALDEQILANRHDMSRKPVREDLTQLELRGLIKRHLAMTSQNILLALTAHAFQIIIEGLNTVKARHVRHDVTPGVSNKSLDFAFVIPFARQA